MHVNNNQINKSSQNKRDQKTPLHAEARIITIQNLLHIEKKQSNKINTKA